MWGLCRQRTVAHLLNQDLSALRDPASFVSSLENFVTSKIGSLTADPSAVRAAASAHAALGSFVKTATYDIPAEVTELTALQTFTTTPAWYTALPSDLRAYYDKNNALVQSLLNEAILGTAAPTGSAAASASANAPASTGAATEKVVGVVGAGLAAMFAGVLAL